MVAPRSTTLSKTPLLPGENGEEAFSDIEPDAEIWVRWKVNRRRLARDSTAFAFS